MDGHDVFRSWMVEHTGLDIDHYITIQSFASELDKTETEIQK